MHFWDRRVSLKNNSVPTTSVFVGLGGAAIARGVRSPQKWLRKGKILSPRGSIWIKKGVFSPCYECHEYACTRMLAYLLKCFFGKKDSLSAWSVSVKFQHLSLRVLSFSAQGLSRGKRTGQRSPASEKLPLALKRDANLVPRAFRLFFIWLKKAKVLGTRLTWRACGARAKVAGHRKRLLRVLACCFGWTSP